MTFRRQTDDELHRMDDDELVAYGRAARDAGDRLAARSALAFLVYGHEADVARRLALRVPPHVVDEVTHDVLVRAVAAAFDGSSVGQFRSWLNTIIERSAADHFRRAARRPREVALPDTTEEGFGGWEPAVDDETGEVEVRLIIDEVLAGLQDAHREVVELHVLGGYTAAEACAKIDGMREDNVAQIASRFRAKLRERLEATR